MFFSESGLESCGRGEGAPAVADPAARHLHLPAAHVPAVRPPHSLHLLELRQGTCHTVASERSTKHPFGGSGGPGKWAVGFFETNPELTAEVQFVGSEKRADSHKKEHPKEGAQ